MTATKSSNPGDMPVRSGVSAQTIRTDSDNSTTLIRRAVKAYRNALDTLDNLPADMKGGAADRVIVVPVARHNLARLLAKAQHLDPQLVKQIADLDQRLRDGGFRQRVVKLAGDKMFKNWRKSARPADSAWWWFLDDLSAVEPSNPVWVILASILLILSITLTTDILRRVLSVGSDLFITFGIVFQVVLALLAGSSFLQVSSKWANSLLRAVRIPENLRQAAKIGFASAVLLLMLVLYKAQPLFAIAYNNKGFEEQGKGYIASAMVDYQRAVALNPNWPIAHYNLATIHEELLHYDDAITEYSLAIKADIPFYQAYNNLAHLYISQQNNLVEARMLLDKAEVRIKSLAEPEKSLAYYTVRKNQGWANLELNDLPRAKRSLEDAQNYNPKDPSGHCLLAKVLTAQGINDPKSLGVLKNEWEQCIVLTSPEDASKRNLDPVQQSWLKEAYDYLNKETK